jgi:lytic murein transglycosylase
VLIALWGVESDYGAEKDRWDVFRSLATLAYARYRHPYFRDELIVAMRIMQDGHYARDRMVSSWAGAMGQSQFMPSNIDAYAVAFSGRGHPDLWNNVPDVLASTANYLAKEHWQRGLPWGFEVVVPQGFNYRQSRGTFAQWNERGVRRADGKPFPQDGNGILFFPSGAAGPAFIATDNYSVLKEYNDSDAYVIAVGHLADRINGGQPIQAKWPTNDRPISRDARIGLQKKLAALGYSVNEFEGHIDFDLRDNIRDEQIKLGMVPDGDPTAEFVRRLGVEVR